jgi:anthranilate synthase component 1
METMTATTFDEFRDLAHDATFVPVCREVLADLLTPVSAFLKVAENADHAFLFESVAGGEHLARYSFLGKDPFLVLRSAAGRTIRQQDGRTEELAEPFMEALRELLARYRAPRVPGLRHDVRRVP